MEWTGLAQEWEKGQGAVNTVLNMQVPKGAGNIWTEELFDYGGLSVTWDYLVS